jgi:hypothetical protein
VNAALALPYSNDLTEGVNSKTKRLARRMYERAGFTLFRAGDAPPRTCGFATLTRTHHPNVIHNDKPTTINRDATPRRSQNAPIQNWKGRHE